MRKFITGISSPRHAAMRRRQASRAVSGFTLLELLVVVVIVAIVAATAVVGLFGAERGREMRTEALRLAQLIELARDEAMLRNRELGLQVTREGYRFLFYDLESERWEALEQRPFHERELTRFSLRVEVEQRMQLGGDASEQRIPQVVILSSGEQTPFSIEVVPPAEWQVRPWLVRSDGLSRTTARQVGTEDPT
jgi:general secretion pathway protein H